MPACHPTPCHFREEEDRDIAAAVRASIAARKQEERRQAAEREVPKARKEELMDVEEARNHKRAVRPPGESLSNPLRLCLKMLVFRVKDGV